MTRVTGYFISAPDFEAWQRATATSPRFDAHAEQAVRSLLARIVGHYPYERAILFGSRARGDHRADSDVDVAVVLKGERGSRMMAAMDMAGPSFDVLMDTGVYIELLPIWQKELDGSAPFGNPQLIEAIRRDGIDL